MSRRLWPMLALLALLGFACGSDPEPSGPKPLSADELLDPEACKDCHPTQYKEWAGSMHAYASEDPVFRAMNARAQRETNGEIGDFCVQCHAPMALRTGATKDGLNLDEVPQKLHGVTCVFCHTVKEVKDNHNAPFELSDDGVMLGGLKDPVSNPAHKMGYSALLDSKTPESSKMCGACHDIVSPKGVHLERTFSEWKDSLFSHEKEGQFTSCGGCHMHTTTGLAAVADGVKLRKIHDHRLPGVDIALTPWADREEQRKHVQEDLDVSLVAQLCVEVTESKQPRVEVMLQNVAAGHSFPSGATQDRRVWVELVAEANGQTIHSSGVVTDDEAIADSKDEDLWLIRERMFDEKNKEVHLFWQAALSFGDLLIAPPKGGEGMAAETRQARLYKLKEFPDEVRMRVRIRPMGLEILRELVKSGDLDPVHIKAMPTFNLKGTELIWQADAAKAKTSVTGLKALCVPQLLVGGADDPLAGADPFVAGIEKQGKSKQLTFKLIDANPAPPAQGNNTWEIEVRDADGAPVTGLKLNGGTWMPDHFHGSPIVAQSEELGAGRYLVAPIELFMPGLWEITIGASGGTTEAPIDDKAVFRFWVAG